MCCKIIIYSIWQMVAQSKGVPMVLNNSFIFKLEHAKTRNKTIKVE
jgi:hypothetical protein